MLVVPASSRSDSVSYRFCVLDLVEKLWQFENQFGNYLSLPMTKSYLTAPTGNRTQGVSGLTWSEHWYVKGELYPKIKFVLFERTLKITE